MSDLLQFVAECWLPLLLAAAFGLALYALGAAAERRRQRALRDAWLHQRIIRL